MTKRTIDEEQLRQLRMINTQLNPGPAVAKILFVAVTIILTIVTLFGVFVQLPARGKKPMFEGTFFRSPCDPGPGVRKDPKCR